MADENGGGPAQQTGEVEVLAVGDPERDRTWKSQKGQEYLSYRIKIKLPDGSEVENVEINTKAEDPKKVSVGEKVFGEFDPRPGNQHGPRFFRKGQGGGGRGGGRSGPSPLEQCRMQRQHSQMVAVDFAAKAGWLDGITPDEDGQERISELVGKAAGPLTWLIDLFDFDIDRGAKIALERRKKDGSIGQ